MSFFTTTILILSVVYIIYIALQLRSDYKKSRPLEGQTEEHFMFNPENPSNVNSVKVTMDQDGISLVPEQPVVQPTFGPIDESQNTSKQQKSNHTSTQSDNGTSTNEPSSKQYTQPSVNPGSYQPPEKITENIIPKTREQMIRTHTTEYMAVGLFAPDLIEAMKGGFIAAEITNDPDYDESEDNDLDNDSAQLEGFVESVEEECESMDTPEEPSYTNNGPSTIIEESSFNDNKPSNPEEEPSLGDYEPSNQEEEPSLNNYAPSYIAEDPSFNDYEPSYSKDNPSFADIEPPFSVEKESTNIDYKPSYSVEEELPYPENEFSNVESEATPFATNESNQEENTPSLADIESDQTEQEEMYPATEEDDYPDYNEDYFESFDYNPDDDIPPFDEMDYPDPEHDEMFSDDYPDYMQADYQDGYSSSFLDNQVKSYPNNPHDYPEELYSQDSYDYPEEMYLNDSIENSEEFYPNGSNDAPEKSYPHNSLGSLKELYSQDLPGSPEYQYHHAAQDSTENPITSKDFSTDDSIEPSDEMYPQDYSSELVTVPSKINQLPPVKDSELERYDFSCMDPKLSGLSSHEQYHSSLDTENSQMIKSLPTKEDNFNEVRTTSNQKIQFKNYQPSPNTYNHSSSMRKFNHV